MARSILRDDQWERIKDLLPGKATDCGVTAKDNRLFVEAVFQNRLSQFRPKQRLWRLIMPRNKITEARLQPPAY